MKDGIFEEVVQLLVAIGGIDDEHPVEFHPRLVRPVRHPGREIEIIGMWCPLHFRGGDPLAVMDVINCSDAYGDEQK